jgi:hypothetical protein
MPEVLFRRPAQEVDVVDAWKVVRAVVFPERQDMILLYVPPGAEHDLPTLRGPLTRAAVSQAFAEEGLPVRVTESVAGRFDDHFAMLRKAERAERASKHKAAEAAKAAAARESSSQVERSRADLITRKQEIDEKIRKLTADLKEAKSRAWTQGRYEDPAQYRGREREIATLKDQSQAIQLELGRLRSAEKAANVERSAMRAQRFWKAARQVLSDDLYEAVLDRLEQIEASEGVASDG